MKTHLPFIMLTVLTLCNGIIFTDSYIATLTSSQGFTITGNGVGGQSNVGNSVSPAGDVNGDGIDDFIIGANFFTANGASFSGLAQVIYGVKGGLPNIDLATTPDLSVGFQIYGASSKQVGKVVGRLGDINNDKIDDIIVSIEPSGPSTTAYIIYGVKGGIKAHIDLSKSLGTTGTTIIGSSAMALNKALSAGDINNDGIPDIMLAVDYGSTNAYGRIVVVYGKQGGFTADIDLSKTLDKTDGFFITGKISTNLQTMASIGDFNGDKIDDILLSTTGENLGARSNCGAAYIVYGRNQKFTNDLDLGNPLDITQVMAIYGPAQNSQIGNTIASAGDINKDGINDIIIGARYMTPGGGAYVMYGRSDGFTDNIDLNTLTVAQGFFVKPKGTAIHGVAVSSASDVNGDGVDDFMLSASAMDSPSISRAGAVYIVYGKAGGNIQEIDLASLSQSQGTIIYGDVSNNAFGMTLCLAGDINNDGSKDLLIGAPNRNSFGRAYVLYGGSLPKSTENAPVIEQQLSGGQIAGITVGCVLFVAIAFWGAYKYKFLSQWLKKNCFRSSSKKAVTVSPTPVMISEP